MFHGASCPHCQAMMPIAEKLAKQLKIKLIKKEVWNNEKNASEMRKYSKIIMPACNGSLGVPAFVNKEKNTCFCGEKLEKELKEWMQQ